MEVKVKFNDINVKEEKEKTLVKILMLKGEKGEKGDGDFNVIEDVKVNGTSLPVSGKSVNVEIPTNNSEFNNDSGYLVENDMQMTKKSDVQNGSQITDGTGYAKLNKIYGDTLQNGTPTPDTHVDIEVVTGDINLTISNSDSSSEQNHLLSLGDIELCKIGDYQDYIYKENGKWYKYSQISKNIIDTNVITLEESYNSINYAVIKKKTDDIAYNKYWHNNTFVTNVAIFKKNPVWDNINNLGIISGGAKKADYWVGVEKNLSLSEVKSKLNGMIIYYVLETPIIIEITDETLINQLNEIYNFILYSGETNFTISSDNLLPFINITYATTNRDIYSKEEVNDLLDEVKEKTKDYYFNSISELRSASLKKGDIVTTLGYYSANDGGGSKYIITDDDLVDNGGSVIALNNGYKAVMIIENDTINVKQFGAKGDNSTEDTSAIQKALSFKGNDYIRVIFNKDGIYLAKGYIDVYSNTDIILDGATIKDCYTGSDIGHHQGLCFRSAVANANTTGYGATKNISVYGGILDGGVSGLMFALLHAENISFKNIYFYNCFVAGHIMDLSGCSNINIDNCKFEGNLITDTEALYREMIQPDYARQESASYWGTITGYDSLPTINLTLNNCSFEKGTGTYYPNAIGTHAISSLPHKNIKITNCKFYDCNTACIRLPKVENLVVENNEFYNLNTESRGDTYAINLVALSEDNITNVTNNVLINNNKFILSNGNLIGIGIKATNDFNYALNNIKIKNNYFESNYTSADFSIGSDGTHIANVKDIIFDSNVYKGIKNCVFKTANRYADNVSFINNIMHFCRDMIRGGGSAEFEKAATLNFTNKNNTWETANGIINTSNFKVIMELDTEDETHIADNSRIKFKDIGNSFISVLDNYAIQLSKVITDFKVSIAIFGKPQSDGGKELHCFIERSGDYSNDIIPEQKYLSSSAYQYLKISGEHHINNLLIASTKIVAVTSFTNNDSVSYDHLSGYLATCIIIESC